MRQSCVFLYCGRCGAVVFLFWLLVSFAIVMDPSSNDFPQLATNSYVRGLSAHGFMLNDTVIGGPRDLPEPCRWIVKTDIASVQSGSDCAAWCDGAVGEHPRWACGFLDGLNNYIVSRLSSSIRTGTGVYDACLKAKVALDYAHFPLKVFALLFLAASVGVAYLLPVKIYEADLWSGPSSTECTQSIYGMRLDSDAAVAKFRIYLAWASAVATVGGNILAVFAALKLGQPFYAILLFVFTYSAPLGCLQRRYFTVLFNALQVGFRTIEYYDVQALCMTSNAFGLALKTFILLRSDYMSNGNIFVFFVLGVMMKALVSNPDVVLAHHVLPVEYSQQLALMKLEGLIKRPGPTKSLADMFGGERAWEELKQGVKASQEKLPDHLRTHLFDDIPTDLSEYGSYYPLMERKRAVPKAKRYLLLLWPLSLGVAIGSSNVFHMSYAAFILSYLTVTIPSVLFLALQGNIEGMKYLVGWPFWVFYDPYPYPCLLHSARVGAVAAYWCCWFWVFPKPWTALTGPETLLGYVKLILLAVGLMGAVTDTASYVRNMQGSTMSPFRYRSPVSGWIQEYMTSQGPSDLAWVNHVAGRYFGFGNEAEGTTA